MTSAINDVLAGNVGFFWPQASAGAASLETDKTLRGYIHQVPDQSIEIRALDESDPWVEGLPGPRRKPPIVSVFGSAENTGLLVPEVLSSGRSTKFGGSQASILRYGASSLITKVDLTEVKSSLIASAALTFAEGLEFAGVSVIEQAANYDSNSFVTQVEYKIESPGPLPPGGSHRGFEVSLVPDWSTSSTSSKHTLRAGLSVELSAAKPRPFSDFRPLLLGVQDLLNLAYDRFVVAESGRAEVDGQTASEGRPHLWMHEAMTLPQHSSRDSRTDAAPLFTLADLGGPAGLRRWLDVRSDFPDVAIAIAAGHRDGGSRQPSRLLEIAAAIEFYVNTNRKAKAKWAQKGNAPSHPAALAKRVGAPFHALVGDVDLWADRLRAVNNGIKHDPSFLRDPQELRILAWSGQVLLLSALLDRAARSKAPSRRILTDYRMEGNARRLRRILDSA